MKDVVTYSEKRFFEWHEDEKSVSIRACSGSYGGGERSPYLYQDKVGALCSTDHKWVQQQQVYQGKLIVMSYQNKTGTLSQGAHPGSYNEQDAYNDMFITERERERKYGQ